MLESDGMLDHSGSAEQRISAVFKSLQHSALHAALLQCTYRNVMDEDILCGYLLVFMRTGL